MKKSEFDLVLQEIYLKISWTDSLFFVVMGVGKAEFLKWSLVQNIYRAVYMWL
jgi:hypothetical protein